MSSKNRSSAAAASSSSSSSSSRIPEVSIFKLKHVSMMCASTVGMLIVALIAILFGIPNRDLEWETTIVPLARQYNLKHHQDLTSSSEATTVSDVYDDSPLSGTTIVVTGATSGIGYALTNSLIQLGGTVIAVGRSSSKLQRLHDHCTALIDNNSDNVSDKQQQKIYTFIMEMSDLSSVAKVGKQIASQFNTIDILVNNAGMHALGDTFGTKLGLSVVATGASPTVDESYDRVFVVNYLSHFLFTELLLPSLLRHPRRRQQATIVQTSSSYHWGVDGSDLIPIDENNNNMHNNNEPTANTIGTTTTIPIAARPGGSIGYYFFRTQRSYANSKLAQIYHARALYRNLKQQLEQNKTDYDDETDGGSSDPEVLPRIVSFCPGWVATNIGGPDDSMGTKILALIAFPTVNGWGIASALHSILSTSSLSENDYYINSKTFLIAGYIFSRATPSWVYQYGFRDVISNMFANVALLTQRLGSHVEATKSSPESYNETISKALYDWSYKAIEKYL